MFGGLLKTTSALAIVAAAGIIVGMTSVQAADLGGDCCADLEERISELEATTVRKGNRKLNLTISGSISEAVIFWNDGIDEDKNIILPDALGASLTISGEGKVDSDRSIGYSMTLNVRQGDPGDGTQTANGPGSLQNYRVAGLVAVDAQAVYIDSKALGRLTWGFTNSALRSYNSFNTQIMDDFAGIRRRNSAGAYLGGWYDAVSDLNQGRAMTVRYDSPSINGFRLSASWGSDDQASVGAGYSGTFNDITVSVGAAYGIDTTGSNTSESNWLVQGVISSASSGLYVKGQYRVNDLDIATRDDEESYYVQGGWKKNVGGFGATELYGLYFHSENVSFNGTEGEAFAVGINQDIDAVGATLFARYNMISAEDNATRQLCSTTTSPLATCEDATSVLAGMTVNF